MASFPIIAALLVILTSGFSYGQSSQMEFAPEDLGNPLNEPRLCGLNTDKASYVCDPDRILGDHLDSINWILRDAAANSTKCPCSNYYCETEKGPKGYRISVAIVPRMKKQNGLDGSPVSPVGLANRFAFLLENKLWAMGNCEEDIVIFYSRDDNLMSINGGSTAMAKLNDRNRDLLAYRAGQFLKDRRIIEGLNNLLVDLKHVLNCDTDMDYGNCGLSQMGTNGAGFTSASLLLTSFVAVSVALSRLF